CFFRIDNAPSLGSEHCKQIAQEQGIQEIVVNQECMCHASPQHVATKLVVELRSTPDMVNVGLLEQRHVEAAVLLQTREETLVVVPVRRVNGNRAVSVSVLGKEGTETVTELACLAFVERRKTEPLPKPGVATQHAFISENVCFKFRRRYFPR